MLKGEKALVQELKELLSMSIAGHAVILTFQCAEYLRTLIKNDRRVDSRVCILDVVQSVRIGNSSALQNSVSEAHKKTFWGNL